ncbi:MAG: aminomethyl-transferring glycine dehydrogenase subunit GcvPA [Alphaproteobacteria bacterium]
MRYLPLAGADRSDMLDAIGVKSIEDLFADVPVAARIDKPFDLPPHSGEIEVERALAAMAAKNVSAGTVPCFLGAGAHRHHIPAAVDHLVQRGEFLTSYTPYQPEISQGTLQFLYEFQTQVALITAMDVANASMYDGASATAEAVMMARRITGRDKVVVSAGLHPHYRDCVTSFAQFIGVKIVAPPPNPAPQFEGAVELATLLDEATACVVVQNPDVFGRLQDFTPLARHCHDIGALLVVAVSEVISLGCVRPPGEMDADIVVAEGQSLGNPMNFGGPYVGLFASRDEFVRQMPGRISGETTDIEGRRGWVLTLATREQHIRRQKATSNICTNSGLCALAFTIHLALLGSVGFERLARINHHRAVKCADALAGVPGCDVITEHFFNEFTVKLSKPATDVADDLADKGVLGGVPVSRLYPEVEGFENLLLVAASETNSDADITALVQALGDVL